MSDMLETAGPIAHDPAAQDFSTRKLSPLFAAEIVRLDLRRKLSETARHQVYDAFVRYHVLCFRDQSLRPRPSRSRSASNSAPSNGISRATAAATTRGSIRSRTSEAICDPSGKVNSTSWHTDKSFRPEPSLATILHAVTMPPEGAIRVLPNARCPTRR